RIPPQGLPAATPNALVLPLAANDADAEPLFFAGFADTPDVQVTITQLISGGQLQSFVNILPQPGFAGAVNVTVVAADRHLANGQIAGRTVDYSFQVVVRAGSIYGTKYVDANQSGTRDVNEPGVEG